MKCYLARFKLGMLLGITISLGMGIVSNVAFAEVSQKEWRRIGRDNNINGDAAENKAQKRLKIRHLFSTVQRERRLYYRDAKGNFREAKDPDTGTGRQYDLAVIAKPLGYVKGVYEIKSGRATPKQQNEKADRMFDYYRDTVAWPKRLFGHTGLYVKDQETGRMYPIVRHRLIPFINSHYEIWRFQKQSGWFGRSKMKRNDKQRVW